MAQLKGIFKRIVLIIVLLSLLIGFCATPASYAKLTLEDGEFYYSGTTKGSYVPSDGIFSWLNNVLSELGSFLLNLITYGVRMVFIGWTALIEKLLTWALETASGVNVEGEEISATDLSAISDSTNNVTVQAIVYNRVPALNVNFFDTDISSIYLREGEDEDGNTITKAYSPTGQELICSKCGKNVVQCCDNVDETKLGEINETKVNVTCNSSGDCKCNGCDACKKFAEIYNAEEPIIIQLKNLVAVWYNLIRLLALAAMLLVLIFIGIKMALSTVASDKAVYKRMLVDWIVGVAIIFLIHYFMYLAIIVTETLVDTIADVGDQVHQVTMMQITDSDDADESEVSDQELEIDMYEEIRTRAYDFNLAIGLSGMIMYMTLVFMAIKYTLIYLKRFLTLAVLTMMAPAIGVAYALQKALTGKSSSLKTWMTEYIMNLIIQVVHALIYAVFVSAALVFSLENVAGIIVALIFLNFASDAEKIFRRIFNLDPGGKGLLGGTEGAGDIDKKIKEAKGMAVGAKPLAKMASAPARAAAGLAGRTATGLVGLGLSAASARSANKKLNSPESDSGDDGGDSDDSSKDNNPQGGQPPIAGALPTVPADDGSATSEDSGKKQSKPLTDKQKEDQELLKANPDDLEATLAKETDALKGMIERGENTDEQEKKVIDAQRRINRQQELLYNQTERVTTGGVVLGHLKNINSINNHYNLVIDKNGNLKYVRKYAKYNPETGKASGGRMRAIFGTHKYNPVTGRYERVKEGTFANQYSAENLLGLSKEDKKILKEQFLNPAIKGFGGMASMMVGMGTLVTNPKIGMAALAAGAGYTYNMRKKFKRPKGYKYSKQRFRFGHFSTKAQLNIANSVVRDANKTLSKALLNKRDAKKHPLGKFRRFMSNPALHAATLLSSKSKSGLYRVGQWSNGKPVVGQIYKAGQRVGQKVGQTVNENPFLNTAYKAGKDVGKVGLTVIGAPVTLPFALYGAGKYQLKKLAHETGINQKPSKGRFDNRHDPFKLNDAEKVRLYSPGNSALEIADRVHAKNVRKQQTQFREDAYKFMVEQAEINAEIKLEAYTKMMSDIMNSSVKTRKEELANIQKRLNELQATKDYDKKIEETQKKLQQLQEDMKSAQKLREKSKGLDNGEDVIARQEIFRINEEKRNLEQQLKELEEIKQLTERKNVLEARNYDMDVKTFIERLSRDDDLNSEIMSKLSLTDEEKDALTSVVKDKKDLDEVNKMYDEAKEAAKRAGVTASDKADSDKSKTIEEKQDEIIAIYLAMGFVYDEKTHSFKRKEESVSDDTSKKSKKLDDTDTDTTVVATKKITQNDVTTINRELNNAIVRQLQGKQIDFNDEKVLDSIMKDFSSSLAKQGILGTGQNADVLFKAGKDGLKSRIKDNATRVNNEVISKKTNLSTEQVDVVKQAIQEVAQKATKDANGNVDTSKLNQDEIYNIVAEKLNLETPKTQQDKSEPPKDSGDGQPQKLEKKPTNISDKIDDIQKDNVKKAIASMVGSKENSINPNSDTELEKAMVSNVGPLNDEQTNDVKQKLTIEEKKPISEEKEKAKTAKEVLGQMLDSIESTDTAMQSKEEAKKAKLEQIRELGLDSQSADEVTTSVVETLFAMKKVNDEMKTDLKAINVSAEEVLPYSSSTKTKARRTKKNYLEAQIDQYDQNIKDKQKQLEDVKRQQEELNNPSNDKDKSRKKRESLDDTVSKLTTQIDDSISKKDKIISAGPVVDVNSKTKDIISNLKKGYM